MCLVYFGVVVNCREFDLNGSGTTFLNVSENKLPHCTLDKIFTII